MIMKKCWAVAMTLILVATLMGVPRDAAYAASTVTNGTFGTTATQTPAGWSTSGTVAADFTESGGRTGYRLTHWSASAYTVSTYQTLTGLANGAYTLSVWTKTDGGQNAAFIGLTCGTAAEQRTNLPTSTDWVQISVSATSTNGSCTISLYSNANAGNYASFDDVTFVAGIPTNTPTVLPTSTPIGSVGVINGDFGTTGVGSPAGWTTTGVAAADYTEAGGRTGYRLTHYSASAYTVTTAQTLTGLANGVYTLRVWTQSGGGQNAAYISLTCSGVEQRTYLPVITTWVQLAVSAQVTTAPSGSCTISLTSDANAGNYAGFDDVTLTAGGSTLPVLGGDLSGLKKNEDFGAQYFDDQGNPADAIQVLKTHGMNYARLKVWVNPADGYNNKPRVLEMAARIKAQGLKLLIDFHYSDFWTDPGQQAKPNAWAGYRPRPTPAGGVRSHLRCNQQPGCPGDRAGYGAGG